MVRFLFYVRYPASFFTVVDNLSLWSIYSHEQYHRYWVEKYGLTDRQRALLNQYSRIREKYPWRKMEPFFIYVDTMEDAWERASANMKAEEIEMLKEVFTAFKDTFDKEWQRHDYLLRRRMAFEEVFRRCNIERAFEEVIHFYDWQEIEPEIDVHLLYNPSPQWGGGGGHAGLQLEVRQDEREEIAVRDFAALLHEAFHILELRNSTREKLRNMGGKWTKEVLTASEGDVTECVTEAALGSLVPNGVIAQKYLGIPEDALKQVSEEADYWQRRLQEAGNERDKRNALAKTLNTKLTLSLLPITKSYLEEKKTVWDNYWQKALKLYFQIKNSILVH